MKTSFELKNKWLIIVVISAAVFSGCRVAPDHTQIDPVDLPSAFSDSGQAPLPDKWWHTFDDAALDALIEQGLSQNFSIRSAWDRLRQAEQVAVKTGAGLLPDVTYQGAARRTRQERDDRTDYTSTYTAALAASYELDLWKRVRSSHEAALLDAKAAREEVAAAAVTLSAAIARTWYQLAESRMQEQLITEQVETNEKILEIISLQFRQGQVGASNVFRQRQLVEATRGQLIAAQERSVLLQHQVAILLGKVPGRWTPQADAELVALPDLPAAGVPTELLQRRPDLRRAGYAIAAADARVYAAVADQYPRISLSASAQTEADRIGDLLDDWAASLAANIVGPLFDGHLRKAEVQRTRAVLSERIHIYAQNVLTAVGEVEDALQQESYQRQAIDNLRRQLDLSEQVYERTRESYLKGQLDYLRVLDALVSQQTLQRNELTARRLLIERRIDLCRSITGDWSMQPSEPATLQPAPVMSMRTVYE